MPSNPINPLSAMTQLYDHVDQTVQLIGQCSKIMWQHIIGYFPAYPHQAYFDLDDGSQTVIYSMQKLPASGRLELTGKVVEIRGGSKRPKLVLDAYTKKDSRQSKVDETYVEYHLLVDRWKEIK
jgi:hypothetical protein